MYLRKATNKKTGRTYLINEIQIWFTMMSPIITSKSMSRTTSGKRGF